MLRISAFIAVLALIGTIAAVASAKDNPNANDPSGAQRGCYSSDCATKCNQQGGRYCELWCQRRASTVPPCKK
jgi:hypothetical protein